MLILSSETSASSPLSPAALSVGGPPRPSGDDGLSWGDDGLSWVITPVILWIVSVSWSIRPARILTAVWMGPEMGGLIQQVGPG